MYSLADNYRYSFHSFIYRSRFITNISKFHFYLFGNKRLLNYFLLILFLRDYRLCNRLRSQIFDPCHKKVNPMMYYKACLQDMCECPTEHCYCQSFMAYAHECKRLGIQLPHWRKATRCRTVWDQLTNSANSTCRAI